MDALLVCIDQVTNRLVNLTAVDGHSVLSKQIVTRVT